MIFEQCDEHELGCFRNICKDIRTSVDEYCWTERWFSVDLSRDIQMTEELNTSAKFNVKGDVTAGLHMSRAYTEELKLNFADRLFLKNARKVFLLGVSDEVRQLLRESISYNHHRHSAQMANNNCFGLPLRELFPSARYFCFDSNSLIRDSFLEIDWDAQNQVKKPKRPSIVQQ